ncbi:MAG: hypothetical protein UZ21_OP11001000161 [Microgenomates bacterium OLB22]|nr:MAG: hypothetical protein UZ21_OP11001000161 [Microgenomates bacterium OLB22]
MKRYANVLAGIGVVMFLFSFLWWFRSTVTPPCLNADEVAYAYNAFSIMKTGSDEHGNFLPLRLVSFNDFKMPMYSYVLVPFFWILGTADHVIRLANYFIGALLLIGLFFLTRRLTRSNVISIVVGILLASAPWYLFLVRQAHESVLVMLFAVWGIYFADRFREELRGWQAAGALLCGALAAFSYHTGRLIIVLITTYLFYLLVTNFKAKKVSGRSVVMWTSLMALLGVALLAIELLHGAARVQSLFLTSSVGFSLKINSLLQDFPVRIVFNKLTVGVYEFINHYVNHFSFPFLNGSLEDNVRFGYEDIHAFSYVAFIAALGGIVASFKKIKPTEVLLLILLLTSPVVSALTWTQPALGRSIL